MWRLQIAAPPMKLRIRLKPRYRVTGEAIWPDIYDHSLRITNYQQQRIASVLAKCQHNGVQHPAFHMSKLLNL
jgi:hypothetical protein